MAEINDFLENKASDWRAVRFLGLTAAIPATVISGTMVVMDIILKKSESVAVIATGIALVAWGAYTLGTKEEAAWNEAISIIEDKEFSRLSSH
jgi:hypothetical protein